MLHGMVPAIVRYFAAATICFCLASAPAAADTLVMVAGDIACPPQLPKTPDSCHQEDTSNLLVKNKPDLVLTAGDNQYDDGKLSDFRDSYDKTWGRLKSITKPTPGNHEYRRNDGQGYYNYFGSKAGRPNRGYYSFDREEWHIIALNSNISTRRTSRQIEWLRKDLTSNPADCTLAFWHHPLFSSGEHGNHSYVKPIWKALSADDADLVITGHDHDYERFAPMNAQGEARAKGIRSFVVGTGGVGLRPFKTIQPHSVVRSDNTFGVLKLTLQAGAYQWEFIPEAGGTFSESGVADCH
ncbi:MAG TPA: metallophosphoesterase [Actinomycetota bacterium]|nr:metallophosphoesterase [Actinomycetota bacterium]